VRGEKLYVETRVDADVEELLAATQDPDEHERWDLRVTEIEYLPREDGEPQRFGFDSDDSVACIGRGTMDHVRNGGVRVYPFLLVGATHATMFLETGTDVPLGVRDDAYVDDYGRETVTWLRRLGLSRPGRFDGAMIYSDERDGIATTRGRTTTSPSTSTARRATGAASASRAAPSDCPSAGGAGRCRCCSRPAPTSRSGTTTTGSGTASRST
jgi:hypothetical protein